MAVRFHHAALEITPAAVEADAVFWLALGFERVDPPEGLSGGYDWFERDGMQIHLVHRPEPVIPPSGHLALAVERMDAVLERLRAAGIPVDERRRHWGERRVKAELPSGHIVELMAAPPAASTGSD